MDFLRQLVQIVLKFVPGMKKTEPCHVHPEAVTKKDEEVKDYMKECECERLMKDLSTSELNHADRVIVRMLHKKCAVIARARNEMTNLDEKFNRHIEDLKRHHLIAKQKSKKRCGFIMLVSVLVTAWFFIMYGVILGSLMCSKLPKNCHLFDSLFLKVPGLVWRGNENEKVF